MLRRIRATAAREKITQGYATFHLYLRILPKSVIAKSHYHGKSPWWPAACYASNELGAIQLLVGICLCCKEGCPKWHPVRVFVEITEASQLWKGVSIPLHYTIKKQLHILLDPPPTGQDLLASLALG